MENQWDGKEVTAKRESIAAPSKERKDTVAISLISLLPLSLRSLAAARIRSDYELWTNVVKTGKVKVE
jgi:hypothetical protein